MAFEYFVGRRFLRAKQKEAFISLITLLSTLGVAMGVMVLIVVIAVMTGFESELTNRILGIEAHVMVFRYNQTVSEEEKIIENIEKVPGVNSVAHFIYAKTMLRSASGLSGAVLRGIDLRQIQCRLKTTSGQCFDEVFEASSDLAQTERMPGVILGSVLAKKLGVKVGDMVHMISSQGIGGAVDRVPRIKRIRIEALFEIGMHEYDGTMGFISLADAQALFGMQGRATGVEVRIEEIYRAPEMAQKIVANLDFPYWTKDWIQMNRNLFSMLKLQKAVMFIILTLIVLVAAFNITSALIMMVMGKTRDIAILKAMGASEKSIHKIFVFKGVLIGIIGILIGLCVGVIICALLNQYEFIHLPGDVYFLTTLPVRLQIAELLVIIAATLLICFLATLYPARRAARFDPIAGIRYGG
jgi:lipoprotein-releasing system permease protein